VERWLNELLCLDAAENLPRLGAARLPHPDECELYVRPRCGFPSPCYSRLLTRIALRRL
jgi:hypothetical protein